MKLRNKGFIIIGLLWAAFLTLNSFATIHDSLLNFITLGGLFALSMAWLIQAFIIKRVEQLNRQINAISTKNSSGIRIDLKGNDEIALIAAQINQLCDLNHFSRQPLEEKQPLVKSGNKESLTWLTHYDKLTSLPNHIFFNETLNKAISHAKRRNKLLAVLLVDASPIKAMKPSLGHAIDASVLKEIGERLADTLRSEDVLVKLEGNEFSILLTDIGKAKFASSVANKILQACAQPIKTETHEIILTTNIGICVYPTEGTSLEDLLKNADVALSKARNTGVDTFRFYTQTMDAEASEYIHLEKSLRKAITNNELTLYYQPKLHLKTGNITRLEALIRWVHPEIGVINPEKFLPIAEETGLIHPIGEWALREACKTNKQWQDAGYAHMPVAINLSPKQFYHPEIVQIIAAVLKDTGLNPNYLELEITETAIMDDANRATSILADIKATGVQISIDHFGAGYFSISQLKQFPLTLLKIDQSFIKGVPNNPNDSAITTAIIALAHNLGLEVVAEGVETAEQVQYLSLQNCDMVQGYFLSQPLPAEQVVLQFKKLMEGVLL